MKRFIFCAIMISALIASCNAASFFNFQEEGEGTSSFSSQEEDENAEPAYYILGTLPDTSPEWCPAKEVGFITDLNLYQTPNTPEPPPRTSYRDPIFGTCIIRVTDREHDVLDPSDHSRGMKNEYARVQSFNADNSLLLVRSIESFWYVYDALSFMPLGQVPAAVEPRWDGANPSLLYFIDDTKLMSYDLSSGRTSQIRDFASAFPGKDLAAVWTRYEGSPSFDTRFWGFMAQDSEWEVVGFLVYDLMDDNLVAREISTKYSIDHVTISPLGRYFLASFDNYCDHGALGSDQAPCGLMVYDRNLENGRGLLRIIGHYDPAIDAEGREVIVYQDIDTDHISMLDLESGKITPLLPIDFSHTAIGLHFSGRASNFPGWGLVSTYNGGYPDDFTWMDDAVFAVELKENGRVIRLAHTQSLYDETNEKDYWAEPHASVNHDFTRVVFTTNWGRTGTEEVDLYLILLPDHWTTLVP